MRLFDEHQIEIIDHPLTKYKEHPVTFGDGDVILTGEEDVTSHQSIDYIFTIKPSWAHSKTKLKCMT